MVPENPFSNLDQCKDILRVVAEETPVLFWITDAEGNAEFVNRAYRDFFGVTTEQIRSEGWQVLIHPEDSAGYVGKFMTSLRERKPFRAQARVRHASGEWRWIDSQGQPRYSERGEFLGIAGSALDITENKRHELDASFLADISRDLSRLSDATEILRAVGEKLMAHLGVNLFNFSEVDEEKGKTWGIYYDAEQDEVQISDKLHLPELCSEEVLRDMRAGQTIVVEDIKTDPRFLKQADSYIQWGVRSQVFAPFVKHGRLCFVLIIQRSEPYAWKADEIELLGALSARIYPRLEQARAEEAVRQSEEKYRILFDSMDEAYCIIEVLFDESGRPNDYRFLEINSAFIQHTGLENAAGKRIKEIVPGQEQHWFDIYGQVALTGQPVRFVNEARHLNRWYDVYAFRIGQPEERKVAVLFNDISERRRIEAATARDLRDMRLLRELSARLVSEENLQVLYQEILGAAITLTHGDAGSVQILDKDTQELCLLATQGLEQEMIDHFARMDAGPATSRGIALATGERVFLDYDVPESADPDGSMRIHVQAGIHSAQSTPLITRTGKPIGMISTHWREPRHRPAERELRLLDVLARQAADLIERAQAVQAIRKSEARLAYQANLLAKVYTPITSTDHQFRITYWNKAAEETFGWTEAEVLGRYSKEIMQPVVSDPLRDYGIQQMMKQGYYEGEVIFRHKDGRMVITLMNTTQLKGEQGEFLGVVSSFKDVTETKRMEQALADSERKYRELVKYAPTAIYEVDIQAYRFSEVNDAMVEMSGYSREELLRMNPLDLLDEQSQAILRERTLEWMAGKKPDESIEYRIRKKNGDHIYAALNTTFNLDENGKPGSATVIAHDITERKLAEMALQASATRDAFRVKLSDTLRPLTDPVQIQAEACRLLGEYLDVGRVHYADVAEDQDTFFIHADYCRESYPSIVGRLSYHDYGDYLSKSLFAGQTLAVVDVSQVPGLSASQLAAYAALKVQSYVVVPMIRNGRLRATLAVNIKHPRSWSADEVALIEEVAERTWETVERALAEAALRKSEERFRTSIDSLNEAFMLFSAVRENKVGKIIDFRWGYVNEATGKLYNRSPEQINGRTILEVFPEQAEMGLIKKYIQVVETGQPMNEQVTYSNEGGPGPLIQGVFNIRASKFGDGLIVTANDITEQARLEAEHQQAIQEREIHHRLAEQREMERQSYARDIHDGPVQTLSSLAFNLQYLKEVYPNPALRVELDQISLSVKNAVQELRQLINELRPPSVIRFGLSKAIQIHVENLREHYPQIAWNLRLANDGQLLPEQTCLTMFRIYQEAVNNIIRHSEASKAWIHYRVLKGAVTLEIRDNGKGFSGSQDMASFTSNHHFGLAGIAERVQAIDGRLEISSGPGKGTTIWVKVPVLEKKG